MSRMSYVFRQVRSVPSLRTRNVRMRSRKDVLEAQNSGNTVGKVRRHKELYAMLKSNIHEGGEIKEMDSRQKGALIAIFVFASVTWMTVQVFQDVAAPTGRRWPVTTGMNLPMVNILDENGYYATLSCTVTSFDDEAHTYSLACGDAPAVITVGAK